MFNPVHNQTNRLAAFPVIGKSIVSSLLVGLLCAVGYAVKAEPIAGRLVSQQLTKNADSVVQRLTGQWQTKVSANSSLTLIFAPESKLFIVLPSNSNTAPAMQLRYRVASSTSSPMQIDLTTSDNKTAPTIFEFTADGKLRMQLNDINSGQPRPSAFKSNAMVFEKVSNNTSLPANAQLRQPGALPQR
ncbi:hypothetical protein H6S82_12230 [Planktothrix sp. FACHB-1355]|uniref:Uncharacterized protein n=1 Tax=Aerosakkonema funiforme FACHB-1375 TaxID=2949571 RepID=A0A926VKP6_9CYAN|nr:MULTISPECIES: hypothetical protein [Oscillatoriales]MBD2185473.1 hypothetical protein [Aerosakkonema funiforme FACHB-1375]MBD3559624.1 hypothetical protein [Planktothrix sp. FACHB-1355]